VLGGNTFCVRWSPGSNAPNRRKRDRGDFRSARDGREAKRDAIRDLLVEKLEAANYPVRDVDELDRDEEVELVATLSATSVEAEELDAVTTQLERWRRSALNMVVALSD